MGRSTEHLNGRREAVKWAVSWLHKRANNMNDFHAKQVLDSAAFNMGVDAKKCFGKTVPLPDWEDLRGKAPGSTGELSSEDFVRKLRDEWAD